MLRVIGDIHGRTDRYKRIVQDANEKGMCTLQLGDLGFGDAYHQLMSDSSFDVQRNRFFMGNHDQYDYVSKETDEGCLSRFADFNLGEFGPRSLGGIDFFMVRGAFSIDYKHRTAFRSWWSDEEIETCYHEFVLAEYVAAKPTLVITHELPQNVGHDGVLKTDWILKEFGFNPETFSTNTGVLLQRMFELHQPKLHIFGHYHRDWTAVVNGTKFVCLPEAGYIDLPDNI
jgi:hypothetical protein